jgi:GTP-binding protein Era
MPEDQRGFVSGFVSILGRPNAGKSTLLNALVGAKLAIVADKPQTTRVAVQGVWHAENAQVIFVDTPGIHRSDTLFNRRMMHEVRSALDERDLLLYLADATLPFAAEDGHAIDLVRNTNTPTFLVLNKIDKLKDKADLLALIEEYKSCFEFEEYIPVSALTGDGLHELRREILGKLPEGPAYFGSDYLTDQPERFLAAEMVREKILRETRQEVPHAVAVIVDHFEDKKTLTHISATIFVEREGQKGIIIGTRGAMLKTIGSTARQDIEKMLGRKIFLELNVKVRTNWRENPEFLNQLDWRAMMGSGAE